MNHSHQSGGGGVAALSVTSNFILVIAKLVIGLAIGSVSVISEAVHSGVDLVAALIALFAVKKSGEEADLRHPYGHGKIENISGVIEALLIFLAAISLGKHLWPTVDLSWVDPVAAILVAGLIFKAAYDLTIESGRDLLDARLPAEEEETIQKAALGVSPKIREIHKLRTRKGGHIRYADMHVVVDRTTSLADAHSLSHQISAAVAREFPGTITTTHIEPEELSK